MKLYDYFRSSAAYRVRIALNLKGLKPSREFVHLRKNVQRSDDYLALNPQGLVPALATDGGEVLTQSLAIIEYLDETHRAPPFAPRYAVERARVRGIALEIACDIHPLNNLRVLQYLKNTLGVSDAQKDAWYKYWIDIGLEALETRLARDPATGRYLSWRRAHARGYLPGAPVGQRAAHEHRRHAVPDSHPHRSCVQRVAGVRRCGAGQAAGCGIVDAITGTLHETTPFQHGTFRRSRYSAPTSNFPFAISHCVGRNYAEHAKEMGGDATKEPPFFFCKSADAVFPVVAPAVGTVRYPLATRNLHHEIELVVAIGKRGMQLARRDSQRCRLWLRNRPRHDAPRPAKRNAREEAAVGPG